MEELLKKIIGRLEHAYGKEDQEVELWHVINEVGFALVELKELQGQMEKARALLRDEFAGKAMQAFATADQDRASGYIAKDAYELADAMLKAREQ